MQLHKVAMPQAIITMQFGIKCTAMNSDLTHYNACYVTIQVTHLIYEILKLKSLPNEPHTQYICMSIKSVWLSGVL